MDIYYNTNTVHTMTFTDYNCSVHKPFTLKIHDIDTNNNND